MICVNHRPAARRDSPPRQIGPGPADDEPARRVPPRPFAGLWGATRAAGRIEGRGQVRKL